MNYADDYPEHSRTSCSDEDPCNFDVDGTGCHRCNALLFDRLTKANEENEQFRTLEEKACTTTYIDLRDELGLRMDQSLIDEVLQMRDDVVKWREIAINMHAHRDYVREMDKHGLAEAIRATERTDPHLAALYRALLEEIP